MKIFLHRLVTVQQSPLLWLALAAFLQIAMASSDYYILPVGRVCRNEEKITDISQCNVAARILNAPDTTAYQYTVTGWGGSNNGVAFGCFWDPLSNSQTSALYYLGTEPNGFPSSPADWQPICYGPNVEPCPANKQVRVHVGKPRTEKMHYSF